ncbi:MAG: PQQ-binding-like beta-propeller repeat protein [Fidelibacterota bacterium]
MKRILLLLILITTCLFAGDTLRFAWMSDTHTSSESGQRDLARAVRDINSRDDLDFVIVSGDLTDYDFPGHIARAKELLDSLDLNYLAIPGNHEYKWTYSAGGEYLRAFGYDRFNKKIDNFRFIGFHQGPLLRMGDGFVAPKDVQWLREQIKAAPEDEKIIVITHYPIDESVRNYRDILEILRTRNVQAILHGHHHHNAVANYGGIPGILGRSTLARNDEGGYNIVTLTEDSLIVQEKVTGGKLKAPWHSMALRDERKNDYEPIEPADYSVNKKYPQVEPLWMKELNCLIAGGPAVTYSRVIVGLNNGDVVALKRRNGKELWRFHTDGPVLGTPVIEGSVVVVASADSCVYGIHLRKGKSLWKVKGDMPFVSSAAVRDGNAYIGGSDGKIRCINISDGTVNWTCDGVEQYIEATPAVTREHVIVGAWDRHLYALDRFTGKLDWKWAGPMAGVLYSPAVCQPVVSNGVVFIVAPDRVMTALDEKTGEVIWRTAEHMVRESIGISEDKTRVYARTMQDSVVCMDATAGKPVTLWKTSGGFGYDIGMAPPVEKDGVLFYPTQRGEIHAMDPLTGKILWKHRLSTALVNPVFPRSDDDLVVTTMDGKVARVIVK